MLTLTNEVLYTKAKPVQSIHHLPKCFLDMLEVMDKNHGVGLAAPQVGISETFFIMRVGADMGPGTIIMCVNPTIKDRSKEIVTSQEGCLSHNHELRKVPRYKDITAAYYDMEGNFNITKFTGLDAFIFQHEMDHLYGKTILTTGT